MPQYNIPKQLSGLTEAELKTSREKFGFNQAENTIKSAWYTLLFDILKEPMLLLLIAVSVIYVMVGNYSEALFMFGAIIAVSGISFYQDNRSKKALKALEKLNEPLSTVIRNSKVIQIPTHDIVVGDLCIVEEGKMINADGKIVHSNDFSVNEASLTGESFSVFKNPETDDNKVYSGTLVVSGLAVFEVENIGAKTKLGKIGQSIQNIKEEISPLQQGVIIKRSSIVETLGSTTVICTDKTGTITENSMKLKALFDFKSNRVFDDKNFDKLELSQLIPFAMWSSEPVPFDPMEKTLHKVYEETQTSDQRKDFQMIHEYPLEGKPPMMTHIFENNSGERIIAAKGAPEAILEVSQLSEDKKENLRQQIQDFGKQGYRVLGVAKCDFEGNDFPEKQQDFKFEFLGFTVFYDPPKKNIQQVFKKIYDAGIKVKVITGDNADTTNTIAQQAGIKNNIPAVTGSEIANHSETELMTLSNETTLFTRMFPEAKLSVVNALKQSGEVVAMLGDGVNDAPALKAAHIGVAMGNKGTEIAKAAAALVITNDDLDKLIIGIEAGRRIYTNIKKAIQYIISIHIPIILTVSLPLFLGWIYPNIFTPVHVIFLELIMGPTCSIVYENEPIEKNAMQQKPRKMTETFLNWRELSISIIQGLMITVGVLFAYQLAVQNGASEEKTRAMVFTTLIFANVFLSLTNRSFTYGLFESFKNKNILFPLIIGATLVLLFAILYIPVFSNFFHVSSLKLKDLGVALLIAMVSVLWFEVYKWRKRRR